MPTEPLRSFELMQLSVEAPLESPWGGQLDNRQFLRIIIALLDSINLLLTREEERALEEPDSQGQTATSAPDLVVTDLNAVPIGTIADIWTPDSGKKFRLTGGTFTVDEFVSIQFDDGASGVIFRTPYIQPGVAYSLPSSIESGLLSSASNNVLKLTSSLPASITGTLIGTEE